ncbi:MAG TPA: permease prefix domain 1-containing protein [Verrucomicrobiae bacterium]|nr:permease prefix domain 1-containing protein [Verrucomicrobiae bacterium]
MSDWRELVRERMQTRPVTQPDEVIEELSSHLEESYNDLLERGYAPHAAIERSLQEAGDWNVLLQRICLTKSGRNPMNDRLRRLWVLVAVTWLALSLGIVARQRPGVIGPSLILFYLPWLATLPLVGAAAAYLAQRSNLMHDGSKRLWLSVTVTWLGAIFSLMVLQRIDHPSLTLRRPIPVAFCWPWLATLVLVGAAGGYLARRADAPRKMRLVVAISPALLLGIAMLLFLPWGATLNGYPWWLIFFAIDAENWVVVPGLALLLGALPFLWQRSGNPFALSNGDASHPMPSSPLPE